MAPDAVRIIDRALLLAPDYDLYRLRAISAITLGDADLILESSRFIDEYEVPTVFPCAAC